MEPWQWGRGNGKLSLPLIIPLLFLLLHFLLRYKCKKRLDLKLKCMSLLCHLSFLPLFPPLLFRTPLNSDIPFEGMTTPDPCIWSRRLCRSSSSSSRLKHAASSRNRHNSQRPRVEELGWPCLCSCPSLSACFLSEAICNCMFSDTVMANQ